MSQDTAAYQDLTLEIEVLGALPVVNHFLARLGADRLLHRLGPAGEAAAPLAPAAALGLLLRCLCVRTGPVYALAEWSAPYGPALLGLTAAERAHLSDDGAGRALALLCAADRASLLTELLAGMIAAFDIDCSELHTASAAITFSDTYAEAPGAPRSGEPIPVIAGGDNEDHRPDLEPRLWIPTVSADGAVPIAYRTEAGPTAGSVTQIAAWDGLARLLGRTDFLYLAERRLCSREAMDHIAAGGGRFLTVLPKTRREDGEFRSWSAAHTAPWEGVPRQSGRRASQPAGVWSAFLWPQPSAEGYRIWWLRSSQKSGQDAGRRAGRLRRAQNRLAELRGRLRNPRSRFRTRAAAEAAVQAVLEGTGTAHLITYAVRAATGASAQPQKPGGPPAAARHRRTVRSRLRLTFAVDAEAVKAEAASDGCFPLITNAADLTAAEVLAAYRRRPTLERRQAGLKSPVEVTPAFLESAARIEGLLCLEFLALLTRALVERELRRAMERRQLTKLPLYPEGRSGNAPAAARIFDILAGLCRQRLIRDGRVVRVFHPKLTRLQTQVLDLLGVPPDDYLT